MTMKSNKLSCAYCNGNHDRENCLSWWKDRYARLESENAKLREIIKRAIKSYWNDDGNLIDILNEVNQTGDKT